MKGQFASIAVAAFAVCLFIDPQMAQAQTGPAGSASGPGGTVSAGGQMGSTTMSQTQLNQLQDYTDLTSRLTKEDRAKGKTLADLLAEDKAASSEIAAKILPSCQVNEAILATKGTETANGQSVETSTYEITCSSGMGYFLVSQEPGNPYAISCFAAEAARAADVAAGRTAGAVCHLPSNANLNVMASTLMNSAGTSCTVKDRRWVGQSSASHIEYDEVKCADNSGYMLAISLQGHTTPVMIATCHDSALRGVPCKMSDNGVPAINLQAFRDALQQHMIECDASDSDIRLIGQENVQKRYVVEFKCTQRPAGLVAYIPLTGAKAPFEALNCATAAKRNVKCSLTAPR